MQSVRLLTVIFLIALNAFAQDPLKVAPQAYKLEFENDWVRVMRVHYAPHAKIPAHDHTKWAAAYVYLNDSGPIIFKHIGLDYGAITRPATKAGSFRLYRAVQEVHEVENPTALPSDFLRVEFKTEPINEKSLRGRYFREDYPAGENYQKAQFENEQVRVTRLICAPGKTLDLAAGAAEPSLFVALSSTRLEAAGQKGAAAKWNLKPGQTKWFDAGRQRQLKNAGDAPAELLRFDFKSKPIANADKSKTHSHPHN